MALAVEVLPNFTRTVRAERWSMPPDQKNFKLRASPSLPRKRTLPKPLTSDVPSLSISQSLREWCCAPRSFLPVCSISFRQKVCQAVCSRLQLGNVACFPHRSKHCRSAKREQCKHTVSMMAIFFVELQRRSLTLLPACWLLMKPEGALLRGADRPGIKGGVVFVPARRPSARNKARH